MLQHAEPMTCPGLFYVTSAQDGILPRMRTPGGLLTSQQGRAVAQFAAQWGDGYIQITNRANLQSRAVCTVLSPTVLTALQAVGLAAPLASVDHLRNIMASDIALLGITIQQGDSTMEGYDVYDGAGEQPFGRVLYHAIPAADLQRLLQQSNLLHPDTHE